MAFFIAGVSSHGAQTAPDFRASADAINATIRANHYHLAELESDAYRQIERKVIALGETAASADDFMAGFAGIWKKGPFSHVGLRPRTLATECATESIGRGSSEGDLFVSGFAVTRNTRAERKDMGPNQWRSRRSHAKTE